MFGYVRPLDCELKVKEQAFYRASYCGLCKAIRKQHGWLSTFTLNYDCTFLALLLTSLYEDEVGFEKCHCVHRCNQTGKKQMRSNPSLLYAADVNVLLSYYKCHDDWIDERKLLRGLYAAVLRSKVKRIKKRLPKLVESMEEQLSALALLESQSCKSSDETADCFAKLLCSIGEHAPNVPAKDVPVLRWLLYNLGRWIYLIDALDDWDEDEKKHRYNPFLLAGCKKSDTAFALYKSLQEADSALALLSPKRYGNVLENILTLGCVMRTKTILKEKQDESL